MTLPDSNLFSPNIRKDGHVEHCLDVLIRHYLQTLGLKVSEQDVKVYIDLICYHLDKSHALCLNELLGELGQLITSTEGHHHNLVKSILGQAKSINKDHGTILENWFNKHGYLKSQKAIKERLSKKQRDILSFPKKKRKDAHRLKARTSKARKLVQTKIS